MDKIIVMAYDEHWATSAPGAIASLSWCKKIADYASSVIPKEKLVIAILGPTATLLAWDLSQCGYQALDFGHIAKDYNSFMKKDPQNIENIQKFFDKD